MCGDGRKTLTATLRLGDLCWARNTALEPPYPRVFSRTHIPTTLPIRCCPFVVVTPKLLPSIRLLATQTLRMAPTIHCTEEDYLPSMLFYSPTVLFSFPKGMKKERASFFFPSAVLVEQAQ